MQEERARQVMAAASRLATAEARWGPAISTPGISVSLIELNRTKSPQGATHVVYQIASSGFKPGEKLSLIRWPLDGAARTVLDGLTVNAQGIAVCSAAVPGQAKKRAAAPSPAASSAPSAPAPAPGAPPAAQAPDVPSCEDTMRPNEPLHIDTTAAPGEAVRVALIGADQKHGAATSAVPFPIASVDKGCKLQALLGMKDAALVLIEGEGFPADASLKLQTVTGGDSRTMTTRSDAHGRMVAAILPSEKGVDAGQITVRYAGVVNPPSLQTPSTPAPAGPACSPAVSFSWGKGSYKTD